MIFRGTFLLILFVATIANCIAQDKSNYGNTPDAIVPYSRYQQAYKLFFDEPQPYRGSGREKLAPTNLETIKIGFLGPMEGSSEMELGMQMLQGAQLAIRQANEQGGYHGIPYELMLHNDVGLWGAAANTVVEMDEEGVWAILGSIDGTVTHVALRIALKLEIPMVNTGDADPTLTETRIPWIIRNISDDRQSSYVLANEIYEKRGYKHVAVLRTNVRYGRVGVKEFSDASKRLGHPLLFELQFAEGDTDFSGQLKRISETPAEAIVIWGNATETAHVVKQMRALGMNQAVFGSDRLVSSEFLDIAGAAAEGVISTHPYNPTLNKPELKSFQANYIEAYTIDSDVFAAHAYDGMNIIIEAIEIAGLNRVKIRDVLTDLKTFQGYEGVTGELILDNSWNDVGAIWTTEVIKGKFEYRTPYNKMNQ